MDGRRSLLIAAMAGISLAGGAALVLLRYPEVFSVRTRVTVSLLKGDFDEALNLYHLSCSDDLVLETKDAGRLRYISSSKAGNAMSPAGPYTLLLRNIRIERHSTRPNQQRSECEVIVSGLVSSGRRLAISPPSAKLALTSLELLSNDDTPSSDHLLAGALRTVLESGSEAELRTAILLVAQKSRGGVFENTRYFKTGPGDYNPYVTVDLEKLWRVDQLKEVAGSLSKAASARLLRSPAANLPHDPVVVAALIAVAAGNRDGIPGVAREACRRATDESDRSPTKAMENLGYMLDGALAVTFKQRYRRDAESKADNDEALLEANGEFADQAVNTFYAGFAQSLSGRAIEGRPGIAKELGSIGWLVHGRKMPSNVRISESGENAVNMGRALEEIGRREAGELDLPQHANANEAMWAVPWLNNHQISIPWRYYHGTGSKRPPKKPDAVFVLKFSVRHDPVTYAPLGGGPFGGITVRLEAGSLHAGLVRVSDRTVLWEDQYRYQADLPDRATAFALRGPRAGGISAGDANDVLAGWLSGRLTSLFQGSKPDPLPATAKRLGNQKQTTIPKPKTVPCQDLAQKQNPSIKCFVIE